VANERLRIVGARTHILLQAPWDCVLSLAGAESVLWSTQFAVVLNGVVVGGTRSVVPHIHDVWPLP
jgi:hypothetical protein